MYILTSPGATLYTKTSHLLSYDCVTLVKQMGFVWLVDLKKKEELRKWE